MLKNNGRDKFKTCEKLIKKILPLRIKILNSIHCNECGVTENNEIMIGFHYNNDYENEYVYHFSIYQIKTLLHIKK